MLKRVLAFCLCILLLAASGCASIIDGEYESITQHEVRPEPNGGKSDNIIDAKDYNSLKTAIRSVMTAGEPTAIVRCASYEGNVEDDIRTACIEMATDDPLGAYAVSYIDYSLNKIVSYYEAKISLTYKKTAAEIAAVKETHGEEEFRQNVINAVEHYEPSIVMHTDMGVANTEAVEAALEKVYYDDPERILVLPNITLNTYPETGRDRITELLFRYPYTKSTLEQRKTTLSGRTTEIIRGGKDLSGDELITYLCSEIIRQANYAGDVEPGTNYDRTPDIYTAYGALVSKYAASEGFAMALKILCNKLGLDCRVVSGLMSNTAYSWNIIKLENGNYYHVDTISYLMGGKLFKNDSEMEGYWWDAEQLPECAGPAFKDASGENEVPDTEEVPGE